MALVNFASSSLTQLEAALLDAINSELQAGTLTSYTYISGAIAPGPVTGTGGLLMITSNPASSIAIPTTDGATEIQSTSAVSVTGGAAGETVVAGNGGLTYSNITPSGTALDEIVAGDGTDRITTPASGRYLVHTGAGNDSINVSGGATVNAGTGHNTVAAASGNNYIDSNGFDSITGSTVSGSGGTDTVAIVAGQATINPGTSNFFILASSATNSPLLLKAGTGSDTVSVGSGGGTVDAGSGGHSILYGGGSGGSATTILQGSATGDQLYATGSGRVVATAGAGTELISAAGGVVQGTSVAGSTANDVFTAGSGNDTLLAGTGHDTLIGGSSVAHMQSGTGPTQFEFQFGGGSTDTVSGFKSTDTLALAGYGISTVPTEASGGNTIISLSDGTTITLAGVTSLNPNQVVLS